MSNKLKYVNGKEMTINKNNELDQYFTKEKAIKRFIELIDNQKFIHLMKVYKNNKRKISVVVNTHLDVLFDNKDYDVVKNWKHLTIKTKNPHYFVI